MNLIVMGFAWLVSSFNYYLMQYVGVDFEGFENVAIFAQISEIIAYASGGIILETYGPKKSLQIGFGISSIAGLIISAYGLRNQASWTFLV